MVKKVGLLMGFLLFSPMVHSKIIPFQQNIDCMVRTTLAEAENQSLNAKIGVLYTIHNRVKASKKSYCQIVNAKNQFSHRMVKVNNRKYDYMCKLAYNVMMERIKDVTNGGTFFHDRSIRRPFKHVRMTYRYDDMIFYKST